jgi:hypothetical protein
VSPTTTALIAFMCIFSGILLGSFFRTFLPEHHLREASRDAVILGTGLVATLVALVLGLLVGSAKSSFDAVSTSLKESSAKIILLDHVLAQYGPETLDARNLLRHNVASTIELIWPEDKNEKAELNAFETATGGETVQSKIRALSPRDDSERLLLSEALKLGGDLAQAHWLLIEQMRNPIPKPFLVVLVFWLVILFLSFGLFSPRNATVISVLIVCAFSVSTAIFLILEMNHPLEGIIKVSSTSLQNALEHLGR